MLARVNTAARDLIAPAVDDVDERTVVTGEDERLAELLAEFGGDDTELRVYHIADGKRGFLFKLSGQDAYDATEVLELIAERAGDGDYEVWLKNKRTRGIRAREKIAIGRVDRAPARPGSSAPRPLGALPPATAAAAPAGVDPALRAILDQQSKLLETVAAALTARPQQKDTLELARELLTLKELFTPPAPTTDFLKTIRDVLAIRSELSEADGGDDPLTAAIKTFGPTIAEGVSALRGAAPSRKAAAAERARASTSSAPAPAQPTEATPMHPAAMFKSYLPMVLELARGGVTPKDAGERIAQQISALPEAIAESVLDFLDGRSADELAELDPRVRDHAQWINDTLDAVFDQFVPEDETANVDAAPPRGVDSAATDTGRQSGKATDS